MPIHLSIKRKGFYIELLYFFQPSTFPDEYKNLYSGTRNDPKNYRPISLFPLVSKIIKQSIHFQIEDHLNKKKLIYMYQSGFRRNHSTDICLAQFIDFLLAGMDKQMHTGIILVDLLKAFDTLHHGVLFEKRNILVSEHL